MSPIAPNPTSHSAVRYPLSNAKRAVRVSVLIVLALAQFGGNDCAAREGTNAAAFRSEPGEPLRTARLFEITPGRSWNTNSFRLHFASEAFVSRAVAHWVPVGEVPSDFLRAMEDKSQGDLLAAWQSADSVHLLRHAQNEDGLHCQYRLIQRSGQIAYWTLLFRRSDGPTGIIDAYDHSEITWFRHIAEGTFLMCLNDSKFRMSMPGLQRSGLTQKAAADVSKFLGLAFDDKYSQALQVYPRLPPSFQSNQVVRLAHGACLIACARPEAKRVREELKASLTDNLIQELSSLNMAYQEKSLYALLEASRKLKEKNGTDAYLDVMWARVLRYKGDTAEAEAEATRAVTAEPTLVEAHSLLIDLALKKGDYATVAGRLRQQERILGIDLSHLAEKEEFADFARSTPGRDWLSSHGNRANAHAAGSRTNGVEASIRRHKLQGIFLSNARPTALIDGRTVEKGDRLPGGYVVQSITNMSVTLVDASGAATVLRVK